MLLAKLQLAMIIMFSSFDMSKLKCTKGIRCLQRLFNISLANIQEGKYEARFSICLSRNDIPLPSPTRKSTCSVCSFSVVYSAEPKSSGLKLNEYTLTMEGMECAMPVINVLAKLILPLEFQIKMLWFLDLATTTRLNS